LQGLLLKTEQLKYLRILNRLRWRCDCKE